MESLTEDAILAISAYLDPYELLHLALCSKRFGGKPDVGVDDDESTKPAAAEVDLGSKKRKLSSSGEQQTQHQRQWSLVEEAARRRVTAAVRDDPRYRNLHDEVRHQELLRGFLRNTEDFTRNNTRDTYLAKDWRLHKFRTCLVFYRLVGRGRASYVNRNPFGLARRGHTMNSNHDVRCGRYVKRL